MSHAGMWMMRLLGHLPLGWVRLLGICLGWVLYAAVASRRKVVHVNLGLCFGHLSPQQVRRLSRRVFVRFAQAWLDRGWLWHGRSAVVHQRLQLSGALEELNGQGPVVIFAPHFVGLDAGWTALTLSLPRNFTTIYTDQANKAVDAWILAGRRRFGATKLFGRADGVKNIVAALRQGDPLYLLPDMNFGPQESLFVPFYGVSAATVPSLSRFAKLGRAKVVPVVTRMTRSGYEVTVMPHWQNYPTDNVQADTALMNQRLQAYIDCMPEQYYWVHKRFKDRPAGQADFYE